jgi:hypothetical protein
MPAATLVAEPAGVGLDNANCRRKTQPPRTPTSLKCASSRAVPDALRRRSLAPPQIAVCRSPPQAASCSSLAHSGGSIWSSFNDAHFELISILRRLKWRLVIEISTQFTSQFNNGQWRASFGFVVYNDKCVVAASNRHPYLICNVSSGLQIWVN